MARLTNSETWAHTDILEDDTTAQRLTAFVKDSDQAIITTLPDGRTVLGVVLTEADAATLKTRIQTYGSVLAGHMDDANLRKLLQDWAEL